MARPKKEVMVQIKLQAPAKQATPGSSLGPALGQHGVNIQEFCKAFNEKTSKQEEGMPIPVIINIYKDRSFSFITKTPPAAYLLCKAANIAKGSGEPNKNKVGKVTKQQIRDIAAIKMVDLNAIDIEKAMHIIEGSARSMGVEVVES